MFDRCRRYWRLSCTAQKLFLECLVLLPLLALAIGLFGFAATQRCLSRFVGVRSISRANPDSATAVAARMVSAAARYGPWRANCLQRSLLLWWLLRRRGIASDLRIGVRRADGIFQAHAWVDCGGKVLNDSHAVGERFAAFDHPIIPVSAEFVR